MAFEKYKIDKEWLYGAYCVEKFSGIQIAKVFNCTPETIYRRLREYGLPVRVSDNRRALLAPWHKKSVLKELYFEQGMSMTDVGKHLGCHRMTVRKWMIFHNLERRESAGTATRFNNRMYKNRFYLRQQYLILGLSLAEIARNQETNATSVRRYLRKFNIPRRRGMNQYTTV